MNFKNFLNYYIITALIISPLAPMQATWSETFFNYTQKVFPVLSENAYKISTVALGVFAVYSIYKTKLKNTIIDQFKCSRNRYSTTIT